MASLTLFGQCKRWETWENARTLGIAHLVLTPTKYHTRSTQSKLILSRKTIIQLMIWLQLREPKKSCSTPTWTRLWWTMAVRTGWPCRYWTTPLQITWIMYITPWKYTIKGRNARVWDLIVSSISNMNQLKWKICRKLKLIIKILSPLKVALNQIS